MAKRLTILVVFLSGLSLALCGQEISHQVIVPFAGLSTGKSIEYTQTGGETMIEVIGSSDYFLTQGFQQPRFIKKDSDDHVGTNAKVYPNPVTDYLTIELWSDRAKNFRIDIINITGTTVMSLRKSFSGAFYYNEPLNVENLLRGLYLVRISTDDKLLDSIIKIEKL